MEAKYKMIYGSEIRNDKWKWKMILKLNGIENFIVNYGLNFGIENKLEKKIENELE